MNAIAPGGVETAIWDAIPIFAERVSEIGRDAAFGELAAMATPLRSLCEVRRDCRADRLSAFRRDAATITGTVLVSDGGYTL